MRILVVAALLLLLAFALPGPTVAAAPAVALVAAALLDRRLLADLRRPSPWLLLLGVGLLPALLAGPASDGGGAPPRGETLLQGLTLVCRGTTVTLALLMAGRAVSPAAIQRLFARLGVPHVGLAVAIALDLLPVTRRALLRTVTALRLRGGLGRRLPANGPLLAMTVLVQTLRLSEEITEALLLRRAMAADDAAAEPGRAAPRGRGGDGRRGGGPAGGDGAAHDGGDDARGEPLDARPGSSATLAVP